MRNGYSPALRHIQRTQRVYLVWIAEIVADESVELVQTASAAHKGDLMTKVFERARF